MLDRVVEAGGLGDESLECVVFTESPEGEVQIRLRRFVDLARSGIPLADAVPGQRGGEVGAADERIRKDVVVLRSDHGSPEIPTEFLHRALRS